MILNLLALTVFAAAVAAGLSLLLRRVAAGNGDTSAATCANCGASAAAMTSFDCPQCRRDVRERGLVRAGAGPASRFWKAMALTAIVPFMGLLALEVQRAFAGSDEFMTAEEEFAPPGGLVTHGPIERLVVRYDGRVPRGNVGGTGRLTLDLYLNDGRVRVLEVNPSMQTRAIDERGKASELGTFNFDVLHGWFAAAASADAPVVQSEVRNFYDLISALYQPPAATAAAALRGSAWSRGGSRSMSRGTGAASPALAATVAASATAWLLTLRWLLGRPPSRRERSPEVAA